MFWKFTKNQATPSALSGSGLVSGHWRTSPATWPASTSELCLRYLSPLGWSIASQAIIYMVFGVVMGELALAAGAAGEEAIDRAAMQRSILENFTAHNRSRPHLTTAPGKLLSSNKAAPPFSAAAAR